MKCALKLTTDEGPCLWSISAAAFRTRTIMNSKWQLCSAISISPKLILIYSHLYNSTQSEQRSASILCLLFIITCSIAPTMPSHQDFAIWGAKRSRGGGAEVIKLPSCETQTEVQLFLPSESLVWKFFSLRKPNLKDQRASSSMDRDRKTARNSLLKVLNNGAERGEMRAEQREQWQSRPEQRRLL